MSKRPLRWLTGKDVFVSYSRRDGADYALKLASDLAGEGYACVIDQWGTQPGGKTPKSLQRDLLNCHALVVVSTSGAGQSTHVFDEIRDYKRTGGFIIPIDIDGSIGQASWAGLVHGVPVAVEPLQADGAPATQPSTTVLGRVRNTCTFRRRDQRLRIASLAASTLLVGLLGASGAAALQLNGQRVEAERLQTQLKDRETRLIGLARQTETAKRLAIAASAEAGKARMRAEAEGVRAKAANLAARQATAQATAAKNLADQESLRASLAADEVRRQVAIADARQQLGQTAETFATDVSRQNWSAPRAVALKNARTASRELMSRLPQLTEADETYIRSILNKSVLVEGTPISGIDAALISADGSRILAVKDDGMEIWDVALNRPIARFSEDELVPWTLSDAFPTFISEGPDKSVVATVNGQAVRLKSAAGLEALPVTVDDQGRALVFLQKADADGGASQLFMQRLDAGGRLTPLCEAGGRPQARFSPDGAQLAIQCKQGLQLWNAEAGKFQTALTQSDSRIADLQFSADGRKLAVADTRWVTIWPVDRPTAPLGPYQLVSDEEDDDFIEAIGFDPSGDRLGVTIEDANAFCINVSDGRELHSMIATWEYGERGAYGPIGRSGTFSTRAERNGRGFTLYDACSGDQIARIPAASELRSTTFNEKRGELLVVNAEGNLFRAGLTPPSLYAQARLEGEATVYLPAKAPVRLVRSDQGIRIWDTEHGKVLLGLPPAGRSAASLSDEGDTLTVQDGPDLRIWRCLRGPPCTGWTYRNLQGAVAGDEVVLGVEDDHLLIVQPSGSRLLFLGGEEPVETPLPDGSAISLLPGDAERPTRLLMKAPSGFLLADLRGTTLSPPRPLAEGLDLVDSSNGVLLIRPPSASEPADDTDSERRQPLILVNALADAPKPVHVNLRVQDNPYLMIASEDGRFVAITQDADHSVPAKEGPTTIEIVDLSAGAIVQEIQSPTQINSMRFDAEGRLALGSAEVFGEESGFRLQLFHPEGWKKIFDVLTTAPASCLAFGSPGQTLVAGQTDGQISIFDRTGQRILHTRHRGELKYCELFGDGQRLSSIASTPQGVTMEVAPGSRQALADRLLKLQLAVP